MDSSKDQKENVAEEQNEDKKNGASREDCGPGKIFVGGLSRSTPTDVFTKHFSKYGELTDSVIIKGRHTGESRGFGFVTYADPSVVDKVIEDQHVLDGKTVEIKRTIPKENTSKGPKTQKIFVGGIPTSITEEEQNEDKKNGASREDCGPGKIFVGGLSRSTPTDVFTKHFSKYGELTDSVIIKGRHTGESRGFGFVTYADPSVVDKVIEDQHVLDGKTVEIKRTIPKENTSKGPKTQKIFVGGIPTSITEDEFKDYFAKFGKVAEHQIMQDRSTGRSRGFGFITFTSEQAVEKIISKGKMIELGGKQVEIKKAEPKKPLLDAGPIHGIDVIKKAEPKKPLLDAGPIHGIDNKPLYMSGGVGGFRDSYSGFGGAGYGSNPYNSAGGYAGRLGGYVGYGVSEYGKGYGGYGGGSLGGYEEVASRGYGGSVAAYREGFGVYGSGMIGGYGGGGYGTYGDTHYGGSLDSRVGGAYGSGRGSVGAYRSGMRGGGDGYGAYGDSGYGGSLDSRVGGAYGGGGAYGSGGAVESGRGSGGAYGSGRGAYEGSTNDRYHPYAR